MIIETICLLMLVHCAVVLYRKRHDFYHPEAVHAWGVFLGILIALFVYDIATLALSVPDTLPVRRWLKLSAATSLWIAVLMGMPGLTRSALEKTPRSLKPSEPAPHSQPDAKLAPNVARRTG